MGPHPNVWAVIQGFIRKEADAGRQIMSNAADLDLRENTGRKSLGEQTREQIKSVVGEYVHLPPKAYQIWQKLAHILSKK